MNTLEHAVRLLATKCMEHMTKTFKNPYDSLIRGEYSALCTALSYLCACPYYYLDMCGDRIPFVLNDVVNLWVDREYYDDRLNTCCLVICVEEKKKKEVGLARQHVYRIRLSDNAFQIGFISLVRVKRNPILRALHARLSDKKYWGK